MSFTFPSDLTCVKEASRKILDYAGDLRLDESALFDIRLCFEEALINAIKYGNRGDKKLSVDVDVIKKKDSIEIVVRDQGKGFDYENCDDPTREDNVLKPRGRGIFIIQKLMDEVRFENNGSCIRMMKKIK